MLLLNSIIPCKIVAKRLLAAQFRPKLFHIRFQSKTSEEFLALRFGYVLFHMCSYYIAIKRKITELHRKILIIQHDIRLHEYTDPAYSHEI